VSLFKCFQVLLLFCFFVQVILTIIIPFFFCSSYFDYYSFYYYYYYYPPPRLVQTSSSSSLHKGTEPLYLRPLSRPVQDPPTPMVGLLDKTFGSLSFNSSPMVIPRPNILGKWTPALVSLLRLSIELEVDFSTRFRNSGFGVQIRIDAS